MISTDVPRPLSAIAITGSREGTTARQRAQARKWLEIASCISAPMAIVHGDCVGADAQIDAIARELQLSRYIFPSTSPSRAHCVGARPLAEPAPPLERNPWIVDAAQVVYAFPKELRGEALRSGTWATIRYARAAQVPVWIFRRDGVIEGP